MKRFLIILYLLLIGLPLVAASPYRISLLTCGPGDELYSTFGHTALRVQNMEEGGDVVYNFGMFSFSDPDFYVKFVRGDLDYYLGLQPFSHFMREYVADRRYVREQLLDLTDEQAAKIIAELEYRYLPENRAYKYQFIRRNCTTEVRDIIAEAVNADKGFLEGRNKGTWRDYLNSCLYGKTWARVGINTLLGSRVDTNITNFEAMCLPELLYEGLPSIADGLVSEDIELNPDTRDSAGSFMGRNYPYIIFVLMALGIILANSRAADAVYCFVLSLLGLLMVFLMFYGTHMEFKANFNLLWCNPLLIVLGIGILKKWPKITFMSSALILLCMLILFIVWISGVQGFDPAFIILVLPLVWISVKYFTGYRRLFLKRRGSF